MVAFFLHMNELYINNGSRHAWSLHNQRAYIKKKKKTFPYWKHINTYSFVLYICVQERIHIAKHHPNSRDHPFYELIFYGECVDVNNDGDANDVEEQWE